MPLRLNVGGSKKVGEASYGSRGASINLELELDAGLIQEPDKLRDRIRHLFGLVRTALIEELNGSNGSGTPPPQTTAHSSTGAGAHRNGASESENRRMATPAQVRALRGLAHRQDVDLVALMAERWDVRRPDDLTLRQASALIDELKSPVADSAA